MRNRYTLALILIACCAPSLLTCDSPAHDGGGTNAPPRRAPLQAQGTGTEPQTTLKIAIYNVLYALAKTRPDGSPAVDAATLARAEQLQADILLLQETNAAWQAALQKSLDARYGHCTFHAPRRYLPEGLAACSRWPIVEDERVPPPADWFPAQRIRIATPGGSLDILNVHLAPAVAGAKSWHAVHRKTRPLRRREIEAFLARPSAGELAIIAGDFNEVPTGALFAPLAAAGFANALDVAGNHTTTWRWAGTELAEQLDHVAYRRSAFQLVSVEVIAGGRSDHVPVVVTLKRR